MTKQTTITVVEELKNALDDFYFQPSTPLDDKFEVMANLFLEQAAHSMAAMSAKDAMIGAGIAIDKMQLLRGLPTEIRASIPLLVQIGAKAADEGIALSTILAKLLNAMNE